MTDYPSEEKFHVEASIRYRTTEEGGRQSGVASGYRGQFYYLGRDWDGFQYFPDDSIVELGQTVRAQIEFPREENWELIHCHRLKVGTPIEIREGARIVGEGHVTKLLRSVQPLPPDWKVIADAEQGKQLEEQLRRELSPGHELVGAHLIAIATMSDPKEIIYVVTSDYQSRIAVVRFTHRNGRYPPCKLYASWEELIAAETNEEEIDVATLLRRYAAGERQFYRVSLPDGSSIKGADLRGATFQCGFFHSIDARAADLRGTTFRWLNLKCSDFGGADLTDAVFDSVLIERAAFRGAIVKNTLFVRMTCYGQEIVDFQPDEWGG